MDFIKNLFGIKKEEAIQETNQPTNKVNKELLESTLKEIDKYKKIAYRPITAVVDKAFNSNSKFGGFPYLRNENDWPICPNCQNHKQLFLQLEMEKLPAKPQQGLLQLFYCTNQETDCDSELDAWSPFSEAVTCRKIEIEGESASITPKLDSIFEEKNIINWEAKDDFPHYEELYDLELDIDDEIGEIISEEELRPTLEKDKLFGYPYWVQSIEYPFDRKTGTRMELIFQIDSEDNLPYMFGDVGIGHITQSPDNEYELAFGWACH